MRRVAAEPLLMDHVDVEAGGGLAGAGGKLVALGSHLRRAGPQVGFRVEDRGARNGVVAVELGLAELRQPFVGAGLRPRIAAGFDLHRAGEVGGRQPGLRRHVLNGAVEGGGEIAAARRGDVAGRFLLPKIGRGAVAQPVGKIVVLCAGDGTVLLQNIQRPLRLLDAHRLDLGLQQIALGAFLGGLLDGRIVAEFGLRRLHLEIDIVAGVGRHLGCVVEVPGKGIERMHRAGLVDAAGPMLPLRVGMLADVLFGLGINAPGLVIVRELFLRRLQAAAASVAGVAQRF